MGIRRKVQHEKHPGHYADEIAQLPKDQWLEEIAKAPASMQATIKMQINRPYNRWKMRYGDDG